MVRRLTRAKGQDMQAFLDMRTLFFVTSILGLVLFACMVAVSVTRKTYSGFGHWTVAAICYFLGNALIGLRGAIPDFFSIVIANAMVTATPTAILCGIRFFVQKRDSLWPYLVPVVTVALAVAYFTYFSQSIRARIVIIAAMHIILCTYIVFTLRRNIPSSLKKPNYLLEISLTLTVIWSLIRLCHTLLYNDSASSLLAPSVMQGASLIIYCAVVLFICFGLCLLNFQRTEYELLNATDEVKQLSGILPMCASCKKIRDDKGYWRQVEAYIRSHSEAVCSHSICPECLQRLYPQYYAQDATPDSQQ